MDRINGCGPRNGLENGYPRLKNLKIEPERQIPLPIHLGYYVQKKLDPVPHILNKQDCQLDKELIREINSQEGYRFTGTAVDYQKQNGHNDIFRNTVVLENYVNSTKPRKNDKMRIFARGGNLCDFLMGTGITPISTLEFDYNAEEKILRFVKPQVKWDIRSFEFSKVGEHRLTGDKSEVILLGEHCVYKVMELITDEYELYYSKEVDGFDGEEPIEIRGVINELGLKGVKLLYRSIALADIVKAVIMVSEGEKDDRIRKVTIIDDFSRYDKDAVKKLMFTELEKIFRKYNPIFERLKRGEICKSIGGIIIIPESAPVNGLEDAVVLHQANFMFKLWNLFKANGDLLESRLLPEVSKGKKLYLCLNNPKKLLGIFEMVKDIEKGTILAYFIEYDKCPMEPKKQITKQKEYYPVVTFWRKIIHSKNPGLLEPFPLMFSNVCTFSPFIPQLPQMNDYIPFNNSDWRLSENDNVLVGEKRYDIERLLDTLSMPLPKLPRRISMIVYTQESCADLLNEFFGDLITFVEPDPNEKIIFCTIHEIPLEADYVATIYAALNLHQSSYKIPFRQNADLYLITRDGTMCQEQKPSWDNKSDLQLLEGFKGLDPIRKFPHTVALFSKDNEERGKVRKLLENTHRPDSESRYPLIFNSFAPEVSS